MTNFNAVKVFSATKARDRECLGDRVTGWLRDNQSADVVDTIVTQSSDSEFHCLTITLFLDQQHNGKNKRRRGKR